MKKHNPKYVICTGISYLAQFKQAFMIDDVTINEELLFQNKKLFWFKNPNGTLVFITPFLTNINGLNSNAKITNFGLRIKEVLAMNNIHC